MQALNPVAADMRQSQRPPRCQRTQTTRSVRRPAPVVHSVVHCSSIGGLIGGLAAVCISLQHPGIARAAPLAYVGSTRIAPQPYPDQQVAPGVYTRPPPSPPISSNVPQRANALLSLLNTARAATREGDFDTALAAYTQGVRQYPDLALSEYARLGRAMLLYQLGDTSQALLELEDCEVSMKGYAEVHAALAAVLYAEKPAQLARAELQWEVASSFDTRYSDVGWVANEKCWPPKLALALNRFLTLS